MTLKSATCQLRYQASNQTLDVEYAVVGGNFDAPIKDDLALVSWESLRAAGFPDNAGFNMSMDSVLVVVYRGPTRALHPVVRRAFDDYVDVPEGTAFAVPVQEFDHDTAKIVGLLDNTGGCWGLRIQASNH